MVRVLSTNYRCLMAHRPLKWVATNPMPIRASAGMDQAMHPPLIVLHTSSVLQRRGELQARRSSCSIGRCNVVKPCLEVCWCKLLFVDVLGGASQGTLRGLDTGSARPLAVGIACGHGCGAMAEPQVAATAPSLALGTSRSEAVLLEPDSGR